VMHSVGIAINRDRESTCHLFGGREFDVFSCEDRDQFNIRDLGHSELGTAGDALWRTSSEAQ